MNSILNDPSIRKEGALYIERLTKETLVKDSVLKLLENTVKDPQFIKSSKELAKDLGQDLIKDPEIESKIINLTLKTLKSGEIKEEIGNLVKWVFLQERTKERLVDLLKSGFEDEKLRNALTNAFSHSFYEVLNQKETIEKLKMFSYFLMENDPEESENVRNMIDTIIEKIVNKKREDTTKSELDKILNVVNEDLEKEKAKEKTEKKEKVL